MTLSELGWDDFFASALQPHLSNGLQPARVAREDKHAYVLLDPEGELSAVCTGRLLHEAGATAELPAVGDWVAVRPRPSSSPGLPRQADIHAVLPRRTEISRAAPSGVASQQVLAANIDTLFLAMGLDANFRLRRAERYVALTRSSGAQPVVLLTKSDLHPHPSEAEAQVRAAVRPVPVVSISSVGQEKQDLLSVLSPWLLPGSTVALLGSSGVGKSTLINRLLGEERLATAGLSQAVNKGRHTTSWRELFLLPGGTWVLDTPGLRELQLWDGGGGTVDELFPEVAALAARCRFRDCTHTAEPDCAIVAALEDGSLDPGRWASYQKLRREQAYAARRVDPVLARKHREHWKKIINDAQQRQRALRGPGD